jgi:hypothetical protein
MGSPEAPILELRPRDPWELSYYEAAAEKILSSYRLYSSNNTGAVRRVSRPLGILVVLRLWYGTITFSLDLKGEIDRS